MNSKIEAAMDEKTRERWMHLIELIGTRVKMLTVELGLDPADWDGPKVSFGYIGDLTNRGDDYRTWYVFLPHPGRVGTNEDSFGGFSTGDVAGARACLGMVNAAIKVARTMKGLRVGCR